MDDLQVCLLRGGPLDGQTEEGARMWVPPQPDLTTATALSDVLPRTLLQGRPGTSLPTEGLTWWFPWAAFFSASRGQEWAPHTSEDTAHSRHQSSSQTPSQLERQVARRQWSPSSRPSEASAAFCKGGREPDLIPGLTCGPCWPRTPSFSLGDHDCVRIFHDLTY